MKNPAHRSVPCVWLMVLLVGACLCHSGCEGSRRRRAVAAVRAATTAADERRAFEAVSRCGGQYTIVFFDAQGMEIRPHETGNYDAVTEIQIYWEDGPSVRTAVKDLDNLEILMCE